MCLIRKKLQIKHTLAYYSSPNNHRVSSSAAGIRLWRRRRRGRWQSTAIISRISSKPRRLDSCYNVYIIWIITQNHHPAALHFNIFLLIVANLHFSQLTFLHRANCMNGTSSNVQQNMTSDPGEPEVSLHTSVSVFLKDQRLLRKDDPFLRWIIWCLYW